MVQHNGHRNYNAWNVSLWINNDEFLYTEARRLCRHCDRETAAGILLESMREVGISHTPDGVPYTKTNIKLAMVGL